MMLTNFQAFWFSSNLQFAFLVDDELCGREKSTATLALVFVIQVDFTGRQIETLRLGIPMGFTESNLAVRKKTDGSAGRGHNFSNKAKVVSNCARDLYPTHAFHLFKSIPQSVVLTLLERLYQDVSVLGTRELVNNDFHAEVASHLSACAKGGGVNGFGFPPLPKAGNASDHKQSNQKEIPFAKFRIFKVVPMQSSPVAQRVSPV